MADRRRLPTFRAVVLERGDVWFVVRPRVDLPRADTVAEVQRLFIMLAPAGRKIWRRLAVGRKRLPAAETHQKFWAYVDRVGSPHRVEADLEGYSYTTKTRGERTQHPAHPAATGRYALVTHDDHTHLVYALDLRDPGGLGDQLRLGERGNFIVAERWSAGGSRSWRPVDPPRLDREGADLLLIACDPAHAAVEEVEAAAPRG